MMTKIALTDEVGQSEYAHQVLGLFFPTPVFLLTTVSKDGTPNVTTMHWVCQVAMEPLMAAISLRPGRYTCSLIQETKEFVLNIPTVDLMHQTHVFGTTTGREIDKFQETGLTPVPAKLVHPPHIAECIAHIECRVTQEIPVGAHIMFVAEIVAVTVEEGVWDPDRPRGYLLDKMKPLLHLRPDPDIYTTAAKEINPQDS